MTQRTIPLAALLVLFGIASSPAGGHELKALIVDGQNNHDWKATTPVLEVPAGRPSPAG